MRFQIVLLLSLLLLLLSCKTAKLSDAVAQEERGEYYDAAHTYRKVYAKTPPKKNWLRGSIAFHMAECYRETGNTQRALGSYTNSERYQYPDSSAILHSAQMLHKLGRYSEAAKQYHAFLKIVPDNVLARNGLIGCDSAAWWKKNPTLYSVKKIDKFNSRDGEFSPMLIGEKYNELIFTSSRKDALGDTKSAITGLKNNDFFLVKQDEKGQWVKPSVIESEVNTEFDEGTASLSADGSSLYYTYCAEEEESPKTAEIRKSSRSGAEWSAGEKVIIFRDSLSMAAHPAVSRDGYLYFVSDVKGGYGGKDLWRILVDEIGTASPENLGPEINTPGDEMFPYVRSDGALYFASNGHPGMGGLDIFKAIRNKEGKWEVENMKSPMNSMADDFGITFEGLKERGFFSSNRNDSRGADHIYSFKWPGIQIFVEGWVLDKEEETIDNAVVRMVGKDGSDQRIFVRKDGTYVAEVIPGMDYVMLGSAQGYLNQKQTLLVPEEEKNEVFYVDFYLPSISKPVLIENIFYDFDKATLRPESKEALDKIITMLNDNPNVTIELSAHTDRKGSDAYNMDLSQRRAQSVVDYLIKGGIEKERLTPVGYGKSEPKEITKNLANQYEFLPEGQRIDAPFIETLPLEKQEIADRYEIPVLEDAAEALGSVYQGKFCGTFGELAALSFNGNKIITTSGGGALVAKKEEYIRNARFLATQARDVAPHYQHSHVGYNYRMSNVVAGIGRGQMLVLPQRVEQRRKNNQFYREHLSDIPGITFQTEPSHDFYSNYWLTTVVINPEKTGGITREDLRLALEKANIESRPLWKPMHLQPVFDDYPFFGDGTSEHLFNKGLCLPSGSSLTKGDLQKTVDIIKSTLKY